MNFYFLYNEADKLKELEKLKQSPLNNFLTNPSQFIANFFIALWQWIMVLAYWGTTLICCACVIIYAVNHDPKTARFGLTVFVVYILLKGVEFACKQ
jgi:hypothetical protein